MTTTPGFPALLRLIDERPTAFRAEVASAPGLGVQVPPCPEWTLLLDPVQHLALVGVSCTLRHAVAVLTACRCRAWCRR
ncbi:hypothetical protein [Streptomyces sp. NPDC056154]|uniref:hypothetical protein n=1 Tax=unclassified Streptomyces TaxID=2593676 RepID=UPI0035DFC941